MKGSGFDLSENEYEEQQNRNRKSKQEKIEAVPAKPKSG